MLSCKQAAIHPVSRHDIAAIWVAFFPRWHSDIVADRQCADVCNAQRRTLCAQVLLADEATGNLTATLRRHGLWDDTILVMSNDVR